MIWQLEKEIFSTICREPLKALCDGFSEVGGTAGLSQGCSFEFREQKSEHHF